MIGRPRPQARRCLTFEHDGAPVRHNKLGPDKKHARLPKRDLAIVTADQSCAPWGISRTRPVEASLTFSVTCAVIWPGTSDRIPVIRAAGMRGVSVSGFSIEDIERSEQIAFSL